MYLLDQLEEAMSAGSRVPLVSRTLVDEQEILEILDQIRVSVPDEIRNSRRVLQERDQILTDARAEADRIVRMAEQQVATRVSDHSIVRAAEDRAADLQRNAQGASEQIRSEAEQYAYRVLEKLHDHLGQVSLMIERGMRELQPDEPGVGLGERER